MWNRRTSRLLVVVINVLRLSSVFWNARQICIPSTFFSNTSVMSRIHGSDNIDADIAEELYKYLDAIVRAQSSFSMHQRWAVLFVKTHSIMSDVDNELSFDAIISSASLLETTLPRCVFVDAIRHKDDRFVYDMILLHDVYVKKIRAA